MTPIPALVAPRGFRTRTRHGLTAALLAVADVDALAPVRATLLLHGFAAVREQDYATLRDGARAPTRRGYADLPERLAPH